MRKICNANWIFVTILTAVYCTVAVNPVWAKWAQQDNLIGTDTNSFLRKLNEKYDHLIYLQGHKRRALKNPEMFIEEIRILKKRAGDVGATVLVPTVIFMDLTDQKQADTLAHRISDAIDVEFIPTGQAWHKLLPKTKKKKSALSHFQAASVQ